MKETPGPRAVRRFIKRTFSDASGLSPVIAVIILLILSAAVYYLYIQKKPDNATNTSRQAPLPQVSRDPALPEVIRAGPLVMDAGDEKTREVQRLAAASLEAKDYGRATDILRGALRDHGQSDEIKNALAETLNIKAVDEYKKGRLENAREDLSEAVSISSQPLYLKNLAGVQVKLKDLAGAARTLKPLGEDPEAGKMLKAIYAGLGDDNYKKDDIEAAVDYFEKALKIDPSDAALQSHIQNIKAESGREDRMRKDVGSHFLVKFEGGENAITGHLIGLLLEEAYFKVGSDLAYYPEDKIDAILYSREEFRDVTRSPSWAGAIYDGKIKIPAGGISAKTGELERVIFHEYTHALVHRICGNRRPPVWIDEGIAQYEEGRDDAPYRARLMELSNTKVSLKGLEGSFMEMGREDAETAYLLSLSATNYIIRQYGILSLKKIFEGLAGGEDMDQAIYSALYIHYGELERSWLDSLK